MGLQENGLDMLCHGESIMPFPSNMSGLHYSDDEKLTGPTKTNSIRAEIKRTILRDSVAGLVSPVAQRCAVRRLLCTLSVGFYAHCLVLA